MTACHVSIGMPVYNGEPYLAAALDSLLCQTYTDFELIISDNASTDRTEAICKQYAAQDARIRYYRNSTNIGATRNYNLLVEMARGQYFKWAAHDDICAPTYLEKCVEILDSMPSVVVCYPKSLLIDEIREETISDQDDLDLRSTSPSERFKTLFEAFYFKQRQRQNKTNPVFGVIRLDVLRLTPCIGNYEACDKVLLAELALRGQFYEVPEYLFSRRDHPNRAYNRSARPSYRAAWHDPGKKHYFVVPRWRLLREYIAAVNRVSLNWADRLRSYRVLGHWLLAWAGARIVKDMGWAAYELIDRPKQPLA